MTTLLEQPGALEAIRKGRRGVHLVPAKDGLKLGFTVLEAVGLSKTPYAAFLMVYTRFFNGEPGPTVFAADVHALDRTYEPVDSG